LPDRCENADQWLPKILHKKIVARPLESIAVAVAEDVSGNRSPGAAICF